MEQNECECPCECPLEVNECTGNLTNAENRLVQNMFHPHFTSNLQIFLQSWDNFGRTSTIKWLLFILQVLFGSIFLLLGLPGHLV